MRSRLRSKGRSEEKMKKEEEGRQGREIGRSGEKRREEEKRGGER